MIQLETLSRALAASAQRRPFFAEGVSCVPFGGGPRQCIGNTFAMMEAQLVLATVAQHYQLRLVPDHPVEPPGVVHRATSLRPAHDASPSLKDAYREIAFGVGIEYTSL